MCAITIANEMRAETREFGRRTRFRDQADYLEAKDAHYRRMERMLDELVRAIGTPPKLSLFTGRRQSGRYSFEVVARARKASAQV